MDIRLWEIGILLLCIGLLVVCMSLAYTILNANSTLKKVDRLVDDHLDDLGLLVGSIAGITGSVNSIVSSSSKIMGLISGAKVVNAIAKKKNSRRD